MKVNHLHPQREHRGLQQNFPLDEQASYRWKVMVINCLQFILVLKVPPVLTHRWPEIISSVEPR